MPEVSVVVPCYNAGADLPRALASVRAQTFEDYEIIVVDDGSTDPATLDTLDSLGGDVRLVRQPNKGLPGARNTGFREAAGKYVVPLDCDDFIDPLFLDEMLTALRSRRAAGYAFCHMVLHGEKSGTLERNFNLFEQLVFEHVPYCVLIPKQVWHDVGGYDESMRDGKEDWEFNLRLATHGYHGILVDKPLFFYCVRRSGMLESTSNRRHGEISKYIQTKHTNLYAVKSIWRIWLEWRERKFTYPKFVSICLLAMSKFFPIWLFNIFFQMLKTFSRSNRLQKPGPW